MCHQWGEHGRQWGEMTADEMAAGDLSVRVEPASATELSRLAGSFNAMADALRDGHERLEGQAADLRHSEAFLDSMLEHIPNMLFVKDASDLKFVRFNRVAVNADLRAALFVSQAHAVVCAAEPFPA
jgi:nitrogen fixation/metabolism regulation signal transduction histidine kinase